MPNATSLEKRIKRRVTGRNHTFFAVTLPGLESLCRQELAALPLDPQHLKVEKGGVSFQARVHDAYAANLHVRTASRILMRIGRFRATAFHQMEKQILDLPWELFLHAGQPFGLKVSSARSRLIHTAAIARRFEKGIAARLDTHPGLAAPAGRQPAAQTLIVRGVEDRFTVSLDSSGALLYKRGLKTGGGKAPLRETLAAAALALTGFSPGCILADPMCGAGTFSLEAALIAARIPPGWYREFAFMGWPCYQPGRWTHLRRTAGELIRIPETPVIFASDIDPQAVERLKATAAKFALEPAIQVRCRDFFALSPPDRGTTPGIITLNPPYGVRLKTGMPPDQLYAQVGQRLKDRFAGWNLALILPRPALLKHLPFSVKTMPFNHGGLDLVLATGPVESPGLPGNQPE
jgi:putative N6-adenine-specific DNA methylase